LDQRVLAAPFDVFHAEIATPPRHVSPSSAYLLFAVLIVEATLMVAAPTAVLAGLWFALGA